MQEARRGEREIEGQSRAEGEDGEEGKAGRFAELPAREAKIGEHGGVAVLRLRCARSGFWIRKTRPKEDAGNGSFLSNGSKPFF